jgi:DNA-binding transcriptional MocR family regulator
MPDWTLVRGHEGRRSLYTQIATVLRESILSGEFNGGERLPTQRALADELGVTLGTVSRAYGELAREGLIRAEVGRGSFVRPVPLPRGVTGAIDLRANRPPARHFLLPEISRSIARAPERYDRVLRYGLPAGQHDPLHAEAATTWFSDIAKVDVDPRDVLLCTGAQHAIVATLMTICEAGDLVLTEALTYTGLKLAARLLSLQVVGVEIDYDGVVPASFDQLCRRHKPRAFVCTPDFHSPTTTVLSSARRREVAAIARKRGVLIVEDDVYGGYHVDPIKPIFSYAPESSVLITSFSKVAAPGLRVGLAVIPAELRSKVAESAKALTWTADPLAAEIVTQLIGDGTMLRLRHANRLEIERRNAIAAEVLGPFGVATQPGAPHCWLPLPQPWRIGEFTGWAQDAGILTLPADAFLIDETLSRDAVRIGLGAATSANELRGALETIAETLASPPGALAAIL